MNGKIQYGSARVMTSRMTPVHRRLPRLPDPARFGALQPTASGPVVMLFGGSLLLGGLLAAATAARYRRAPAD